MGTIFERISKELNLDPRKLCAISFTDKREGINEIFSINYFIRQNDMFFQSAYVNSGNLTFEDILQSIELFGEKRDLLSVNYSLDGFLTAKLESPYGTLTLKFSKERYT